MSASVIWEWISSFLLLVGVVVKLVAVPFLAAVGAELAKRIVQAKDRTPDPP